jgi:hypothetical protein
MDKKFKAKLAQHISNKTEKRINRIENSISYIFDIFDELVEKKQIEDERKWNDRDKREYLLDRFEIDLIDKIMVNFHTNKEKEIGKFFEIMREFVRNYEREMLIEALEVFE